MYILKFTKSSKSEYGACIHKGKKMFYKKIKSRKMFFNEIDGYNKVCNILKGPRRIAINYDTNTIFYEYIEKIERKTIHHHLYNFFKKPKLTFLENQMSSLSILNEKMCSNRYYFKNRLNFLNKYISKIAILHKGWKINNKIILPTDTFFQIKKAISAEKMVVVFLSQGDPTAINLLNDGRVIDYEISGYNSIVGEMAIFLSNILFSGYYFFIKYADGEYSKYEKVYKKNKKRVKVNYYIADIISVNYKIYYPKKNKTFAIKYINKIKSEISESEKKSIEYYLKYYLAFRLLTPKKLDEMTQEDLVLTIAMVLDIIDKIDSFEDLIEYIMA